MPVQLTISWKSLRLLLVGLLGAAVVGLAGYGAIDLLRPRDPFGGVVNAQRYQAVVLTSGVVYFGHLEPIGDDFYHLRDAFFIQETPATEGQEASRRVAKLSEELHGPENAMLIPKEQVVLVENLRANSPVTKAALERSAPG